MPVPRSGIVVLASGNGSNFGALVAALPGYVRFLICNRKGASVCDRAKAAAVPFAVIDDREFPSRLAHESAVLKSLQNVSPPLSEDAPGCLVLAGYMRILTSSFLQSIREMWPGCKIVNLHPADLGVYRGAAGYAYAVQHRFPYWRLTVHEVTEELDRGPVVLMQDVCVFPWETADQLHARLQREEHSLLIGAVQLVCSNFQMREPGSVDARA